MWRSRLTEKRESIALLGIDNQRRALEDCEFILEHSEFEMYLSYLFIYLFIIKLS